MPKCFNARFVLFADEIVVIDDGNEIDLLTDRKEKEYEVRIEIPRVEKAKEG